MNIAFTLCSINYVAQAKNLWESFRKTNPDWHFIIGLVDKNTTGADLSFLDCSTVYVEEVGIPGFEQMVNKYTIVELLTSVKPFYFTWLFGKFPQAENIVYFDPDIMVFRPLSRMEAQLNNYDILLTPHFTTPIEDDKLPTELHVKQTGIYNLGFLALHRSENTMNLLEWWEKRLATLCLIDLSRGLFVDQLWMDLAPVYFDKVLIDKFPGYNMAHWNLHERILEHQDDGYYVNGVPLVFYHFSHYKPTAPDEIASFHTRFNFNTRPDLRPLYEIYKKGLLAAHYEALKGTSCYYLNNEKRKKRKRNIENFLRVALPSSLKGRIKGLLKK